jgi:hypothetical protein
MQLDDLTESIQKGSYRGVFKNEGGDDEDEDVELQGQAFVPPILDDSEQEGSDLDPVEEEENDSEEEDDEEEEEGTEDQDQGEDEEGDSEEEESQSGSGDDEGDQSDQSDENLSADIYRPSPGEDIYGRPVAALGTEGNGGKYIPPARRQQAAQPSHGPSSVIDEVCLLSPRLSHSLSSLPKQSAS